MQENIAPEDKQALPVEDATSTELEGTQQNPSTSALNEQAVEKSHPQKTILVFVGVSMGFGLIPVPILDIAAVTAVQMEMLRQLSKRYNADWSDVSGRFFITSQAGVTLARLAAGAIKTIPGVGTVIGAAAQAILSGASTFAIGQVFLRHFGENKGNFENFDPKKYKDFYKEQFKKGRKVAEEVGENEVPKHEGETLESIELNAEALETEETRNFLERSSDSFTGFYQTQMEKVKNWRNKEGQEALEAEIEIESIPEDLKVDPAEMEAERLEEEEDEFQGAFFSRSSEKLWGYYQNFRKPEEEKPETPSSAEDAEPIESESESSKSEEEEDEESFLDKSTDKLKGIYDSSLGKGVKWVSKLGKKDSPNSETPDNETK